MPTTTITVEDIVKEHAADVAYVAEESPATTLDELASQLDTAAPRFADAGIIGWEDLETAATLLTEAQHAADHATRDVFLKRADELLAQVWEMASEYREMVGG